MKILFYLHSPAAYHFDFFLSLIKLKVVVTVIYQNRSIKNFNWRFKNYKWVFFLKKNNKIKYIKKIIKCKKPNIVIIGGYRMHNENIFISNKSYLVFYWLERLQNYNYFLNKLKNFIIKIKSKKVDGIISIGKKAENFYKKFHKTIINIPYSLSNKNINLKKKKYDLNFLFVGQLIKRKGVNILIKAISKINDSRIKFTIVGDGPLKKKIKFIKNKNFEYYNFLNKNKLLEVYQKNSILIMPSKFDGWGVVLIEAMMNGLAIISSNNVGAFEEYIKHGINGRKIKGDFLSIVKEVNFFCKNKDKIKEYGMINRKKFCKNLSNSNLAAKKFIKFIKKM
jgi:glycosyltransferase involved in cell wall biosynthesis